MKCSRRPPLMPGQTVFRKFDSGIARALLCLTSISISPTATSPFSSESILSGARPRHENSRSVFDQSWMSFDLAPTRYEFASGKWNCRFGLRLSRRIFFRIVNTDQWRLPLVCAQQGYCQQAQTSAPGGDRNGGTAFAQTKTPASLPGFCIRGSCRRSRHDLLVVVGLFGL